MNNQPTTDLQEALRPITSLLNKSEKAQQKLSPATWQHAMLEKNIKALHIAVALKRMLRGSRRELYAGFFGSAHHVGRRTYRFL